jgi:hypothetical protein
MLNFSRDSEREHYPKKQDLFMRGLRGNNMSVSYSQKSEHRTTSPASILNFKYQNNLKDFNPNHSRKSFLAKRDMGTFLGSKLPGYQLPTPKMDIPQFSFGGSFRERLDSNPSINKLPNFTPIKKMQNLGSLEPIVKIDFRNQFHKKFLLPQRSTKKLQFPNQNFLNKSIGKERRQPHFYNSRENSISYQDSQIPILGKPNFDENLQINRPKYNENLLSSMRPPSTFQPTFNSRFSQLNFSNPNSRRFDTFKPISKLNLSTNDKVKRLDVIEGSELASKVSHTSISSKLNLNLESSQRLKDTEIKPKPSEKFNIVEPCVTDQNARLQKMINEFQKDLEEDIDISEEDAMILLLILKFLFDFDITQDEFSKLSADSQNSFRKFVIDRYFKDETERDNQLKFLYHDVLVKSDEEKNMNTKLEDLVDFEKVHGKVRKDVIIGKHVKFISVKIKKCRKGIIDSIGKEFLKGFNRDDQSNELNCKAVQMNKEFLLNQSPKILLLQNYLRRRERLNLICRRRKKMHKKSKRNDEKIKKIFKRIMKSLLKKYQTSFLGKSYSVLNSMERETAFYTHYFGHMDGEIEEYYDPLKRKLENPKFKSISTKYLTYLARSDPFVKELKKYCTSEMVPEVLEKYPGQLLKRFKENPNFLLEMDKFKTKFEWIRHELEAAIFHFMSIFKICLNNATK